jgi:hypothetical protein
MKNDLETDATPYSTTTFTIPPSCAHSEFSLVLKALDFRHPNEIHRISLCGTNSILSDVLNLASTHPTVRLVVALASITHASCLLCRMMKHQVRLALLAH